MNNTNNTSAVFEMDEEDEISTEEDRSEQRQTLADFDHNITTQGDEVEAADSEAAASPHSSFLGDWPQSYREATDSYAVISPGYYPTPQHVAHSVPSSHDLNADIRSPLLANDTDLGDPVRKSSEVSRGSRQSLSVSDDKIVSSLSTISSGLNSVGTEHGCTVPQTVFNGVNAYVGLGLISMPSTVQEGGWISVGLLVLFAVIAYFTGSLMRKCLDSDKRIITYPDIGQAAFGKCGRLFLSIIFYIELYFSLVEFIILDADNLAKLFPSASIQLGSLYLSPKHVLGIIATLIILPTCYMKDLRSISFISAAGVLGAIFVFIALILVGTVNNIGFHQTGPVIKWSGIPYSLGVFGFAYSGHSLIPNLYHSMSDKKKFNTALILCFVLSTLIYGSVGVLGFLMFGENTKSEVTLNLPSNSITSQIALWIIVLIPLTKFALMLLPLSRSLEELLPSRVADQYCSWIILRTGIIVLIVCVAFLVPFFGLVMALIGSLFSMLASIIMPSLCYLRIVQRSTLLQMSMCYAVAAIGVVVAALGTYSSISDIIDSY